MEGRRKRKKTNTTTHTSFMLADSEWLWLEEDSARTKEWVRTQATTLCPEDLNIGGDVAMVDALVEATSRWRTGVPVPMGRHWWMQWHDAHCNRPKILLVPKTRTASYPLEFASWTSPPRAAVVLFDMEKEDAACATENYRYTCRSSAELCAYKQRRHGGLWDDIRIRCMRTCKDLHVIPNVSTVGTMQWCTVQEDEAAPPASTLLYCSRTWMGDVRGPQGPMRLLLFSVPTGHSRVLLDLTEPHQESWVPHVHIFGQYMFVNILDGFRPGQHLYFRRNSDDAEDFDVAEDCPLRLDNMVPVCQDFDCEGRLEVVDVVHNRYLVAMSSIGAPYKCVVVLDLLDKAKPVADWVQVLLPGREDARILDVDTVHLVPSGVFVLVQRCGPTACTQCSLYKVAPPGHPEWLIPLLDPVPLPLTDPAGQQGVHMRVQAWDGEPVVMLTLSGVGVPGIVFALHVEDLCVRLVWRKTFLPRHMHLLRHRTLVTDTDVPVVVFGRHLKGNALGAPTRPRPCIVTAYGGFSLSVLPVPFAPELAMAMCLDPRAPLVAIACVRGGEERGTDWAAQGRGSSNKVQSLLDVKAAVDLLCFAGLTQPGQVALQGSSNGGMLMLACITKWPTMAGAVWAQSPLTDMLRFMHGTCPGRAWMHEFGNPCDSDADAHHLRSISPLHNVVSGPVYPPIVLVTSPTDACVPPWHAYKMAAALQAAGAAAVHLVQVVGLGHAAAPVGRKASAEFWVWRHCLLMSLLGC